MRNADEANVTEEVPNCKSQKGIHLNFLNINRLTSEFKRKFHTTLTHPFYPPFRSLYAAIILTAGCCD